MTNRRWAAGLVGAALILTPGVASFGQEAPPVDPPARPDFEPEPALEPTEPPAAADPNDNGLAPRPSSPGVRPSIAPRATPAAPARSGVESIPGLKDANFLVGRAPLRAEGTFFVRQPGSMLRLHTGERVFIFARDAAGQSERPMVLLPSGTLARMERLAEERPETVFLLTGQVFVYRGLNYALPTAYAIAPTGEAAAPAAPQAEAQAPADTGAIDSADPAVEDLIRELEAQRVRPRTLERSAPTSSDPAPEISDAGVLVPEDEFIVRRRGRMVRLSGGEWAFVFESDADGDPTADPPMVLTPSLNLQRMESYAAKFGEAQTFEVSGRVLAYDGRNYLIPTMFRVQVPSDLRPMQ